MNKKGKIFVIIIIFVLFFIILTYFFKMENSNNSGEHIRYARNSSYNNSYKFLIHMNYIYKEL